MDEKYLQDLYSWIVSKDPSYQKDVSPDAFKKKMTDPTYVSKMHSWISSLDPTFQKDMTIDKFNERVGIGKKKEDTALSLEGTSLVSPKIKPERAVAESTAQKPRMIAAPPKEAEKAGYLKTLYDNLALGASYLNEAVVSLPETIINLFAVPQNFIAEKTGWNIGTNADQVKKQLGIKNPLLDWVQESQKVIKGDVAKDIAERYNDPGIVSNFQKGNYQDAFELLGASIVNSAPISLSMMYGGAVMAPERLAAITTLALTEGQRKELEEMDPTMKESEKMMKALGMAGAESVFESLGSGTIGRAYRDIAAKEGKEAAKDILKNGLVTAYKKALEKTGPIAGFAGEGLEEAATQITQNVISGRPTFEGVADAFAAGAGGGVIYTAPISAVKAKKYIQNKVETYQTKDKIGEILKDKADNIGKVYNVPVASEITPEQIEITNLPKSRDILVNNLRKNVDNGTITEDDAKQSLYVFDKVQQVSNSVKDLDVSTEDKAKIATLLKQRDEIKTQIQNKDDVLVVEQKKQIEEINNQIQSIITKSKEDAIQKQAAGEVPVQPTPGVSEEVEGGKPQPKLEVITTESIQEKVLTPEEQTRKEELTKALETPNEEKGTVTIGEEVIPITDAQKQLASLEEKIAQPTITRVKVAPFFNTQVASVQEAEQLRQSPEYKTYIDSLNEIGNMLGVKVTPIESIGGYENEKGERIVEISNDVDLENATIEQAENFAALAGALAPQVQESAIAAQYTNQGDNNHNANEYSVVVSDVNGAIDALKKVGITDFSINEKTGEVSFIDVLDFTDPELQKSIGNFLIELESKGINYEQQDYKPLDSRRIGKAKRKAILGRIKSAGPQLVEGGQDILPTIEEAVRRDAEFQGVNREEYFQPRAGNRLFNKPLTRVSKIADRYYERVFGKQRPKYYGSEKIDEARAKRIADAFDKMKHDPNNPKVKAAYEAMARETLDQYKDFLDAGYTVEINNDEPYRNSQEMIEDLRNNKRMKIFSTESGFGDNPITEQQRKENPLLRDSGYKDANGQPMLINDVFRAIHDFYGHAELGNSFGPKGEENAWNVHARMFSPLARAAMTTETRGQNSYVNFSGINDSIKELQKQARALREEGLNAQARKIEEKIYEQFKFADQKTGLLPEEFYQIDETDIGDTERVPSEEVVTEEISQELTEQDLPGYDRMMTEIDGIVRKSENRGVPFNKIMDNVMEYMKKSKAYEDATDVQREALVRDIRNRFQKKEKAAPSAAKILGVVKEKVTVGEMAALKDQIRLEARAAREAKKDLNGKRKQLTDFVRSLAASGVLTAKKTTALINKIGKVNLDSRTAVDKFVEYAANVFNDADYSNKLSAATTVRSQVRKLSKNKEKAANLRDLGSKFAEIDPSMVDDIDAYNNMAAQIRESIKGSSIRGTDVKFANMVKEGEAIDYINKTMEAQRKKLFDIKVAEIQDLLGVDASELNYEQLLEMAAKDEPITKYNETIIRDAINKAFDIYSSLIKQSIKTGKDLFTGEDVSYTDTQKKTVNRFMDMDLNVLTPKESLQAVDALMNFIQNGSTAKMDAVVKEYTGEVNARQLVKEGVKSSPLKKYWSKSFGRFLGEQTTNLNLLFEKMFKGVERGGRVEDMSGVTELKNKKSAAQTEANNIVNDYVNKFYDKKANGEAFNTQYNNVERGLASFMMRNVIGTEAEMKKEFDRRKGLIEESIQVLSEGNEQERSKAETYQKAYDKILKDANNIEDIVAKADKTNMDAVKFWQEQWANKYEQLSDVSQNVYNKILGKDINYNPDKFTKLSSETGPVELSTEDMAFNVNNGTIYKKETGVLMEATRPESLPKNPKNNETSMYIDLSFDRNNANSMYDALVDIGTAAPIRQVEAFLNSSSLKKIVPQSEDAEILKDRVNLFVRNIRNKNPYSNDELSKAVRKLNKVAAIGVGQALGGVLQPIKQVIPVAMNTLVNAGSLDLGAFINPVKNKFINNSGYAIANRGVESQAQIESINKLIDEAAKSKGEKALNLIEKANKKWLEIFLVKPDVAIARASWMSYYEQSLEKQGIDPNKIDYSTHEVNDKAADYAQRMVDRQQNVSDADLAGKLFADKEPTKQVFVKMLMPFASFRMNQASRLGSDLGTLMSNVSTQEDRKIAARSLFGFGVEMATFRIISAGTALLIANAVKSFLGREDDEEKDKKKKDAILKGQLTSTVADLFSPLPITDKLIQAGVAGALEKVQDAVDVADENKISIYSGTKQDFVQSLGLFGIAADRALLLYDMANLSSGGSFKDDYGRKKYLSERDRQSLKYLIAPALLTNMGLAPSEVSSIIKSAVNDAKRNASTIEGGKTSADIQEEKQAEEATQQRKEKQQENKSDKIEVLTNMKEGEVDEDKRKVIQDMIDELEMSAEEKKATKAERSKEKREKSEKLKKLLQGYDNRSDMRRYDPQLYEETFGENSDYYLENQAEMEVEKEMNKLLREKEDEEMEYTPSQKRKKGRSQIKSFKFRRSSESNSIR